MDDTVEVHDSSGFDTGQDKTFLAGQMTWSGSFSGFKDGAPLAKGTELAAQFKESAVAAQKWTGTIIITTVGSATAVDGIVAYDYTFTGTGALTAPSG
jgi:hypothetical protein